MRPPRSEIIVGPAVATMVWSRAPRSSPVMRPAMIRMKFLRGMVWVGESAEPDADWPGGALLPLPSLMGDCDSVN